MLRNKNQHKKQDSSTVTVECILSTFISTGKLASSDVHY